MGHYASEMDPNWGKPSVAELRLREVEDDDLQALARTIAEGFGNHLYADSMGADLSIKTVEAIDDLIQARIKEAVDSLVVDGRYVVRSRPVGS